MVIIRMAMMIIVRDKRPYFVNRHAGWVTEIQEASVNIGLGDTVDA